MKDLRELAATPEGVELLAKSAITTSPDAFVAALEPPATTALRAELGHAGSKLVCTGQQLYADYQWGVLKKIVALRELARDADVSPMFLWLDTDRSGADRLTTKLAWPPPTKKGSVTVAPKGSRDVESRYVQLDEATLRRAIDKIETYLRQSCEKRSGAKQRYDALREQLLSGAGDALTELSLRWTNFLLGDVLGHVPPHALMSSLLARGHFRADVERVLEERRAVVTAFNASVRALREAGVDSRVHALESDYLPLFFACATDGRRVPLRHVTDGETGLAVGRCRCGVEVRFELGRPGSLSLEELASTGRWSPDVLLPLLLSRHVSGIIAGRSSGLYMLVLNDVLRSVFGDPHVPVLVPLDEDFPDPAPAEHDSLVFRYLSR